MIFRSICRACFLPLLLLPLAAADTPAAVPATAAGAPTEPANNNGSWVTALLSKVWDPNPGMEMTVITEMTAEGRKLPPVTPAHPAYYDAQPSGDLQMGGVVAHEQTMPPDAVAPLLVHGLAVNGYQPAQRPGHPPSLLIFYLWGTHNALDPDIANIAPYQLMRNVLDRAMLVGGKEFADEVAQVIQESQDSPLWPPPVQLFIMRKKDNERLLNQALGDVFYVVASAYDYASVAKGKPTLLWRTRMTVGSQGVWMKNAIPAVVATAAPYFGKEMTESVVVHQKVIPQGKVDVGQPRVVGDGQGK